MESFDLIIVGGGPGGYVCAIKAAQMGKKVACVEKRSKLGGTCLNEGCIPSKILLDRTHLYHTAKHKYSSYGISVGNVSMDLKKLMKHKEGIVDELAGGIDYLFKSNKITKICGLGKLKSANEVVVTAEDGKVTSVHATNIVLATGSEVASLPGLNIDGKHVISSREALSLPVVPKSMAVIGAGVIGLELGSVFNRLGSEVTVIEYLDRIVPSADLEVANALKKFLEKQGMKFKLDTKFKQVKGSASGAVLSCESGEKIKVDKVLVAVGRKPCTDNLGIELEKDNKGFLTVNSNFETSVKGVFAIGDTVKGPMLAHKAEEEGVAVVDVIMGKKPHIGFIPSVVYTHPEVASVGCTEEELKAKSVKYNVGKFVFSANSRARVMDDLEGFVKVLTDEFDTILGVHIVGPQAGTLIGETVVAVEYGASAEDISLMCHSHPDLNEAFKEACLAAFFKPIHS